MIVVRHIWLLVVLAVGGLGELGLLLKGLVI